jgi:UDP-GlcNAc:undecaprenyl-phosphate GlcNAc-1-phosphate transferase
VPFLIALAVSVVGTAALVHAGPRLGLVDHPGDLKVHGRPVPLAGVALAAGVVAGVWSVTPTPSRGWVAAAVVVALLGGLVDDLRPLSPWARIPVQVVAALCLVAGGLRLEPLGDLGSAALAMAAVACCNAVNMVDGQDGLAAGLSLAAAAGLAGVAAASGVASGPALAIAGAAFGFLVWNRPPARVFLGDGGAYALGIAFTAVAARPTTAGWPALLAAAVCLGLFVYELVATVVRRLRSSTPTTLGDREHSYDRLAQALGSRPRSTLVTCAAGAVLAVLAQAVARVPAPAAVALTAAGAAVLAAAASLIPVRPIPRREESR